MRRQASLEDGAMLILAFFNGLRSDIRKAASMQISSRFGNQLPSSLESIIQLVSLIDDDFLSGSKEVSRKRKAYDNKDKEQSNKSSVYNSRGKSSFTSKSSSVKKQCRYCYKSWFHGHKCDEFPVEYQEKVSRMAIKRNKQEQENDYIPTTIMTLYTVVKWPTCPLNVSLLPNWLKKNF